MITLSILLQVTLSLYVASTSMVHSDMRGRMGGLFNLTESLGRFLGPVGSATLFAWSISPSSYDWVGNHFMFFGAASPMALVAALAWAAITREHVMTPAERKFDADIPIVRGDGSQHTPVGSPNLTGGLVGG